MNIVIKFYKKNYVYFDENESGEITLVKYKIALYLLFES